MPAATRVGSHSRPSPPAISHTPVTQTSARAERGRSRSAGGTIAAMVRTTAGTKWRAPIATKTTAVIARANSTGVMAAILPAIP
jgi:hypothetical protein